MDLSVQPRERLSRDGCLGCFSVVRSGNVHHQQFHASLRLHTIQRLVWYHKRAGRFHDGDRSQAASACRSVGTRSSGGPTGAARKMAQPKPAHNPPRDLRCHGRSPTWIKGGAAPVSYLRLCSSGWPLRHRKFRVVTYRHNWGEDRVYFHNAEGRLSSIPACWTTVVAPDPFVAVADGRCFFRYQDLIQLADLMGKLR
jgi:hypothetical protein